MTTDEIKKKLQELRELWKQKPQDRPILKIRAMCLKIALKKRGKLGLDKQLTMI